MLESHRGLKKRAVVYARVSTKKYVQENSLDIQLESIEEYCLKEGFEHIETYIEQGGTGTSLRKRPAFIQMMYDAGLDFVKEAEGIDHFKITVRKPKFDVIFVKDISRFSRNTQQGINAIDQLLRKDVNVVFLIMGISTFDTNSNMLLQLLFSVSESESQAISDKVKFSKRNLSKKNIYRPSKIPYGYTKEYHLDKQNYKVGINPNEAEIIREIFRLYNDEGMGGHSIATYLNGIEINVNGAKRRWTKDKVIRIIKDTVYYGSPILHRRTKRKVTEPNPTLADSSNHIQLHDVIEPIISKEYFEKAQEQLRSKIAHTHNISKQEIMKQKLFKSKIKCLHCGGTIGANFYKGNINYYCVNYKKFGKEFCGEGTTIRESQVSKYVMASNVKIDNIHSEKLYKELNEKLVEGNAIISDRSENINTRIKELKEQMKIKLHALKVELDESVKQRYREEIYVIRDKMLIFEGELAEFDDSLIIKLKNKIEKKHKIFMELSKHNSSLFTLEERINLIEIIKVNSKEIIVEYKIPTFNDEIMEFNEAFKDLGLYIEPDFLVVNKFHYERNKSNDVIPIENNKKC